VLGIGARRTSDPRQIARVLALDRAEDLAAALLAPLDDSDLGSLAKQSAAIKAYDATFPLQTATVELSLPADGNQVGALGWQDMQQLAARLLQEDEYQPEPLALEP